MNNSDQNQTNWWKVISIVIIGGILGGLLLSYIFLRNETPRGLADNASAQNQSASAEDLKIKGNRNSRIYHLKGCPNYADIKESNIVWFKTTEEAEKAGFRMAKNC